MVCPNHALNGTEDKLETRVELDIEGNQREVIDAKGRVVVRYAYNMAGPQEEEEAEEEEATNRIHQASMEAGARWMLNDVADNPIRAWDSRGHAFRTEYDPLRRPLRTHVIGADPANPNQELLTERLVHGEQHPEAEERNLRGQLYLHLDQAGAAANEAHDFKGNPLCASRRIATQYKQAIDWSAVDTVLPPNATTLLDPATLEATLAPRLEADTFTTRTTYDALNRPVTLQPPDNSVIRPAYNEANLLEGIDVNLRGATEGGELVWTPFVTDIDYNAKGQRTLIDYGNGARTTYTYDRLTFRLARLLTIRGQKDASDCSPVLDPRTCEDPPAICSRLSSNKCVLQNLHYTYDPAGNITHIRDDAQQTIYFKNRRVEPSADYTYDAIYRLIEATGREHLGQVGGAPIPHSHEDAQRVGLLHPGDGDAMGGYTERYVYDAVGNFLQMQHRGSDPGHGWTRTYAYGETSLIEDGTGGTLVKTSNRLSSTRIGAGAIEEYTYDAHGNMIRMPHLGGAHPDPNMHWDYRDQLRQADLADGGKAYYVYDDAGQRVRKVIERQNGTRKEERIYLGGFEIYREYEADGNTVKLERETLHIMDDKRRIALAETRTQGNDGSAAQLIHYQFGNHLGSANLELDDQAHIISYEEYTPYGSTSYQAVRNDIEASAKRYRYTGKERDEETGLYYHGARYYAAWLGRWTAVDPEGFVDGMNLYRYSPDNPIGWVDPRGTDSRAATSGGQDTEIDLSYSSRDLSGSEQIRGKLRFSSWHDITSGKYDLTLRGATDRKFRFVGLDWRAASASARFLRLEVPSEGKFRGSFAHTRIAASASLALSWTPARLPLRISLSGEVSGDVPISAIWKNSLQGGTVEATLRGSVTGVFDFKSTIPGWNPGKIRITQPAEVAFRIDERRFRATYTYGTWSSRFRQKFLGTRKQGKDGKTHFRVTERVTESLGGVGNFGKILKLRLGVGFFERPLRASGTGDPHPFVPGLSFLLGEPTTFEEEWGKGSVMTDQFFGLGRSYERWVVGQYRWKLSGAFGLETNDRYRPSGVSAAAVFRFDWW